MFVVARSPPEFANPHGKVGCASELLWVAVRRREAITSGSDRPSMNCMVKY
jgi:hypothetical protein